MRTINLTSILVTLKTLSLIKNNLVLKAVVLSAGVLEDDI